MFQLLKFKTYDQKLDEEHLYKKKLLLLTGHVFLHIAMNSLVLPFKIF